MKTILALLLIAVCAGTAIAQVPNDVPREHWAYQAVEELASEGYVMGYSDGQFLGERTLTRYEFATIVARILNNLETKIAVVESKAAANRTSSEATAVTRVKDTTTQDSVSPEQLATINKLVNEFKVELAVIGTRLDKVEENLDTLQAQVGNIDAAVFDPEGVVQATKDEVSKLKKIGISGYVQARYQTIDPTKEDTTEEAYKDTFLVRRGRVKVTGKPTDKTLGVLQLDYGKNTASVKDAYLGYAFGESFDTSPYFYVGQQNWWFGYEVPYSSSRRETPERALFIRRFFPGERDTGLAIFSSPRSNFSWNVGVYNGTGVEVGKTSAEDQNDAKDYLARLKWSFGDIDLGISGYWGDGVWTSFKNATYADDVDKVRYGADLQIYFNKVTFKGEYIRGKGFDDVALGSIQDEWIDGYYAQLNYNLTTADTLVARYASMSQDPKKPALGRRSAWDLGWVRWLDDKQRIKLFYKINNEQFNEVEDNDGWLAEWIMTY